MFVKLIAVLCGTLTLVALATVLLIYVLGLRVQVAPVVARATIIVIPSRTRIVFLIDPETPGREILPLILLWFDKAVTLGGADIGDRLWQDVYRAIGKLHEAIASKTTRLEDLATPSLTNWTVGVDDEGMPDEYRATYTVKIHCDQAGHYSISGQVPFFTRLMAAPEMQAEAARALIQALFRSFKASDRFLLITGLLVQCDYYRTNGRPSPMAVGAGARTAIAVLNDLEQRLQGRDHHSA